MLNLRVNNPSVKQEMDVFQVYTQSLAAPEKYALLQPPGYAPDEAATKVICNWLQVQEEDIRQCSEIAAVPSANNALFCILSVLRKTNTAIGAETFTFPGFRFCAAELGYQVDAIACDEEGILPVALQQYLETSNSKLVYLQPTVHNPTTSVMSLQRRQEIIAVIKTFKDVYLLEDDAYRFLHADPPPSFLQLIPERTFHVYSFSKAFNPILKAAYIVYPKGALRGIDNIIGFTASSACALFIDFGIHLMQGEQLKNIIKEKQRIALEWHARVKELFQGLSYQMFPGSFHIWLKLEHGLTSSALTSYLHSQDIDVPDGAAFAVNGDTEHVRIALGTAWHSDKMLPALTTIAAACKRR